MKSNKTKCGEVKIPSRVARHYCGFKLNNKLVFIFRYLSFEFCIKGSINGKYRTSL